MYSRGIHFQHSERNLKREKIVMHVLCIQFYLITKLKLLLEIYTSEKYYTVYLLFVTF